MLGPQDTGLPSPVLPSEHGVMSWGVQGTHILRLRAEGTVNMALRPNHRLIFLPLSWEHKVLPILSCNWEEDTVVSSAWPG